MLKEEGLAKFTEKIISGIPLNSIKALSFSAPSVVLAQIM